MVWGFCVYFVYMIPLETDVLRKHRFKKRKTRHCQNRRSQTNPWRLKDATLEHKETKTQILSKNTIKVR